MSNFRKDDTERLAGMLKALSSPQRLHLFMKLTNCCEPVGCCTITAAGIRQCVGDLGDGLGLAASTVSHHLKELRQAGVLRMVRRGQRIECSVCEDAVRLLADFFAGAMEAAAAGKAGSAADDGGAKDGTPES